jgi:hypothetical protein
LKLDELPLLGFPVVTFNTQTKNSTYWENHHILIHAASRKHHTFELVPFVCHVSKPTSSFLKTDAQSSSPFSSFMSELNLHQELIH